MVLLQHQGQANGTGPDGRLLAIACVGSGGNSGANGKFALLYSDDSGATWAKSTLATPAAGSCFAPRGMGELDDGTVVFAYSYDSNTNQTSGHANLYVSISRNGGATWSNLSTSPA